MKVETKRKLVIVAILGVSIVGMLSLAKMRPAPPKKPVKESTLLIDVIELQPETITFRIPSQGTVKPRTVTNLGAEVSGRIVSISDKFIAGGVFQKDEILMQIDPTDYQVALQQANALMKQRQIEYDGAKSLNNKGYRAEAELAAASASLAAAKAAVVKATKNLDRTNIRLPYDGLVKSKNSDIGQFVNPGTHLGTTFAINTAEVRLALTDQDLAFLNLPQASDIASTGYFDGPEVELTAVYQGKQQLWPARIIRTEGVVDENSRVTYVVAQIIDPYNLMQQADDKSPLPVGTFVRASIQGKTFADLIKIPRAAIRGKNELMFIDQGNRLQIREVMILRADKEFAYIQQGITPGSRLSITAIESPVNGMKVRTTDDEPDAETADEQNTESLD